MENLDINYIFEENGLEYERREDLICLETMFEDSLITVKVEKKPVWSKQHFKVFRLDMPLFYQPKYDRCQVFKFVLFDVVGLHENNGLFLTERGFMFIKDKLSVEGLKKVMAFGSFMEIL